MKLAFALLLLPALIVAAAPGWEMQYFHDESKSSLTISDIRFPSAQRGLASGWITENRGQLKPVVLVTSDGGSHWTQVPVKEPGRSLFCLDETACWMVTPKGLWFSSEAGRAWRKIRKEEGINSACFVTREHGWMFGAGKKMLETRDAGKTWKQVSEATALKTETNRTVFYAMSFATPETGLLTGRSEPVTPRRDVPLWMDTEPELRRERPSLSLLMDTRDGGASWKTTSASMFGRFSKLTRPGVQGVALGLIEFDRYFSFASEVYRYDFSSGKLERSLRRPDIAVTDVGITAAGEGVAGGYEPPGRLARTPVPGKVRMFTSKDLKNWDESPVDYRAVARRVSLAVVDAGNMWAATDTGMILRLVR